MFLIVGLGNPGIAYRKSRHNAGFWALDALADACSVRVHKREHRAITGEGRIAGEKVLLAKPQTYMNLSGEAVQALLHYYKIPVENLVVLYDDIDIPAGTVRIRAAGSAGTHNGMRSIIASLGGEEAFSRVRIGVGRQQGGELKNYVLGKPSKEEAPLIKEAVAHAADAARLIVRGELAEAQALYNKKHAAKAADEE